MNKNFNIDGMGVFGIVIGFAGLLFAGWQAKKTDDICRKLGSSMEDVEKKTTVDIQDSIINKAVEKAVDREVKLAVADTAAKIRDDIHGDVASRVKEAVNDNLDAIESAVETKAQELVDGIDKEEFGKKIEKQGAKILSNEFNGKLNGLLSEAKGSIDLVTNTWNTLMGGVNPFRKNGNSGVNFHID